MNAYRFFLPLALLLAACTTDDDDDSTGAGGTGGSGGSGTTQGSGGAGGGGGSTTLAPGVACSTPEAELALAPEAIKGTVTERKADETPSTAAIVRYDYNGTAVGDVNTVVYYVPPPPNLGDGNSELIAQDGTIICSPDGGFSGSGDGKCPDFSSKRANPPPAPGKAAGDPCIVWEDSRKTK